MPRDDGSNEVTSMRPGMLRRLGQTLRLNPTARPTVNVTLWSALGVFWLLVVIGLAVGSSPAKSTSATAPAAPASAQAGATSEGPPTTSSVVPSTSPATSSVASTVSSSAEPSPVDTTGGIVLNAAGAVLPDPTRTPGASNPAVTQATIGSTICVSGWTATIRPPSSYTTSLKERQLASGYAFNGDMSTADYEEDHLISLEIGGAPSSELNLWPEPYNTPDGARVKDQLENKLHSLVCSGAVSLATAQHAIAGNWWNAYLTYIGIAPSTPAPTSHAVPPPPPQQPSAPAAALTCNASMSNSSPAQYSTVDVIVHTVAGAAVTATAHYKTKDTTNTAAAGPSGQAEVPFAISRATVGYTVRVDVTVSHGGASSSCSTSFTPH